MRNRVPRDARPEWVFPGSVPLREHRFFTTAAYLIGTLTGFVLRELWL